MRDDIDGCVVDAECESVAGANIDECRIEPGVTCCRRREMRDAATRIAATGSIAITAPDLGGTPPSGSHRRSRSISQRNDAVPVDHSKRSDTVRIVLADVTVPGDR